MAKDPDVSDRLPLQQALTSIENARQTSATKLDLSNLNLAEIPVEVRDLKQLESLDLSFNFLSALPDWILELNALQYLDVSDNELATLPADIDKLTHLRELLVWGNPLLALPEAIGNLQNLETLEADITQLQEVPVGLSRLTNLKSLQLMGIEYLDLPEGLELQKLERLNLGGNRLTELPAAIRQFKELKILELEDNNISELPVWIGELLQLEQLGFNDNELSELPHEIGSLKNLRILKLASNGLEGLPRSIGELTRLELLNLADNVLSGVPFALAQLKELRELDLSSNRFTELPIPLRRLTRLVTLDASYNQLTQLPKWIGELTELNELTVSHNKLKELPERLKPLTSLTNLKANNNELTELPEDISELPKLAVLDLANNRLTELPEGFSSARSLKAIYLHGNDRLGLPAEILGPESSLYTPNPPDARVILEYYARLRTGKRPLNEAKLILVGRGAAGKTSIVNRLVHNIFKQEKKTEGIKITDWKLRLNGSEDVRLNIWDFGGQEIMHATHQFFLTQRSLYLLVLNGREGGEDSDAEYWLKLIESFGGDSPVLVILNKIKEHPFDINRLALRQKYPAIREVIKTDCEDGTGIEQLRKSIERETDQLESLRDPFPAAWFSIKNKLAAIRKNYLTFEEYRKLCAKLGERDTESQELLTTYLHRLGVALNYKDDPRLRDTHVLNPHWVTNGIYKVLNAKKLEEQRGDIRLTDLSEILDAKKYPVSMHRFLFDLMKKFELCFSFPDDDARYLIPELLDKQQPAEADQFRPDECLNFQYHYPILPEGLLPRFIVRTHFLSERLQRWRTGVIMEFEGCRALVKADVQDRKVFISVLGPSHARRRLLAIVRSDFESIHYNIRNLQAEEMVPVPNHADLLVPYRKLQVLEKARVKTFTEVAGESVIELNVEELLDGVNFEHNQFTANYGGLTCRLFYSYSHKDEGLRNELDTHLKLMQRQGVIKTWYDRRINPGDDFERKIDENLELADIILLLVSSDFMASDYCYEKEMERALERHRRREAVVIPVIVRDVNWSKAPFAGIQALPKDGRAVELWPNRDSAWREVSREIEYVATYIEAQRQNRIREHNIEE